LKKVDPAPGNLHYSSLLLDHNDIARLENVETYCSLIKVKHYQKFALFFKSKLILFWYSFQHLTIN
jgi:hypothetical protein